MQNQRFGTGLGLHFLASVAVLRFMAAIPSFAWLRAPLPAPVRVRSFLSPGGLSRRWPSLFCLSRSLWLLLAKGTVTDSRISLRFIRIYMRLIRESLTFPVYL